MPYRLMPVWVEACCLVISNKCIALCPPNSIYKGLGTLQNKRQTCFFNPRGASCLCLLSLLCTYGHTRTPRFPRMNLSLWKILPVALSPYLSWWLTSLECLRSHHLSLWTSLEVYIYSKASGWGRWKFPLLRVFSIIRMWYNCSLCREVSFIILFRRFHCILFHVSDCQGRLC